MQDGLSFATKYRKAAEGKGAKGVAIAALIFSWPSHFGDRSQSGTPSQLLLVSGACGRMVWWTGIEAAPRTPSRLGHGATDMAQRDGHGRPGGWDARFCRGDGRSES